MKKRMILISSLVIVVFGSNLFAANQEAVNELGNSDLDGFAKYYETLSDADKKKLLYLISYSGFISDEQAVQFAQFLIDNGADVDFNKEFEDNRLERTPLMAAVTDAKPELVELLLSNKADPSLKDLLHMTAYDIAQQIHSVSLDQLETEGETPWVIKRLGNLEKILKSLAPSKPIAPPAPMPQTAGAGLAVPSASGAISSSTLESSDNKNQ